MDDWIEIGNVEDIPSLGSRVVQIKGETIAVFRTAENEIFALLDHCPHKGGPLSQGIVHGKRVTCPLHNLVLDLSEGKAVPPDGGCVFTYPVRIEGGKVLLLLQDNS